MSETIRESASRLSGIVPVSLGWTPDQFWNATPDELAAIFGAHADADSATTIAPLSSTQFEKLKEHHPDA